CAQTGDSGYLYAMDYW
nr:immunoglobulin heavy chain junction region [Mus musculus]MBK4195030.1 immunoglobulin heavy chain junction region [Mus musculus]